MLHLLLVAVGGAIGAGIRHLFNLGALRLVGPNFPWGTMVINIIGSFVMGAFIATLSRRYGGASSELRLFVATGILGGFTGVHQFVRVGAHSFCGVHSSVARSEYTRFTQPMPVSG